jgi:hypothetical protein
VVDTETMIEKIKHSYLHWKENLFLKKHGCENRAQYERKYDPDYNPRAIKVKDYFHGYPYVHCVTDPDHTIYFWDLGFDGFYVTHRWCKENCAGKFRIDILRVFRDYIGEWEINEIGGRDYFFIAFKEESDMMWFRLRWAGINGRDN